MTDKPVERPDETPQSWDELKALTGSGYWSKSLGRFVRVRMMTPEQAAERFEQMAEWLEDTVWQIAERRPRSKPVKITMRLSIARG